LARARLVQDKKSRGGSTQKSYFGMNLASPFKNRWPPPGRAEENGPSFVE
jgi:hypothetical protein